MVTVNNDFKFTTTCSRVDPLTFNNCLSETCYFIILISIVVIDALVAYQAIGVHHAYSLFLVIGQCQPLQGTTCNFKIKS